jgi:hypothetical protein
MREEPFKTNDFNMRDVDFGADIGKGHDGSLAQWLK